ncbi:hypothetical protein BMT54_08760 [Pasteurellaceae bacterium 15-036681]|nr:hypothetical protein BMT54_08760 [Pasteurellaceae bacterium 15-036681]
MFNKNRIAIAISLLFSSGVIFAEDTAVLDEVSVVGQSGPQGNTITVLKASDTVIEGKKFKKRSATLGNALDGELGVHSNPFGGGASTPIIRGQEGVRVKILQNNSDVIDMSSISPDHAVSADTLLSKQVELLRGSSTLMYASSSPAGVVNIVDGRIPMEKLSKGYEVEASTRFDTASKEKVGVIGASTQLGEHLVVRAEGLSRHSDNYRVPSIQLSKPLNYVPDTYNKSKVGTLGLSYVSDKGYLGIAYSERRDTYGLPGHNHKFDSCIAHIYNEDRAKHSYTFPYPHLLSDETLTGAPHFHCGSDQAHDHAHSHDNPYGHQHDHTHKGPWVEMNSKRTDIRGELKQPNRYLDKVRFSYANADYYHDERDAGVEGDRFASEQKKALKAKDYGKPVNIFKNKGENYRLELYHSPFGNEKSGEITGVVGVQYQTQKTSANTPDNRESRWPLVENKLKQISLFGIEQYAWKDFAFELGGRIERQKIDIDYDLDTLQQRRDHFRLSAGRQYIPDLSEYRENAYSYTGTVHWFFHPDYQLSFVASHNERLPSPMELYYHGQHLATNSFEYGNRMLKKEQSNNAELSLGYHSEKLDYKLIGYYSQFKNYIFNENLYREANLYMRRYNQAKARFYGLEAELTYRFTPDYQMTIFGDMVQGKLLNVPNGYEIKENPDYDPKNGEIKRFVRSDKKLPQADRNAPRVPPTRLGMRFNAQLTQNWLANFEYTRVFTQNRVSKLESVTKGYNLLNAGVSYENKWKELNYTLSLTANNLLNESVYIHSSFHPFVPQIGRNFILGLDIKF